ncbi:MAG: hypothetical protein EAZ08_09770 [Cytophagales bacterium]|nr:MAG: hypothetical protein EAZ08_09770 [Cytophagales bacterium]
MRHIYTIIIFFLFVSLCYAQDDAKLNEAIQRGDDKAAAKEALSLARTISKQKREKEALAYFEKAIDFADKTNDLALRAVAYEELGDSYYRTNEPSKAIKSFNIAAKYHAGLGAAQAQTQVINRIGFTEKNKNKNYEGAIKMFKRSLQIAQQNNLFATQLKSYELLAETYSENGDETTADVYRKSYSQLKNAPNSTKIVKYDVELKEVQEQYEATINSNETQKRELQNRIARIEKEKSKLSKELTIQGDSLEIANYEAKMSETKAMAEEERRKSVQNLLYVSYGGITLLVIFSVFLFSLFRSRNIANKKLAEQNVQITKQSEELEKRGKDLQKEKEKSEKLLLNILPAKVAEELKEKNYSAPRYYEKVTVLFTDFKGFTTIAEKMTPEEIIGELNTIFSEFDRICKEYNLEKIKTIGDAYMCAGGIPEPNDTNAVDAVYAALEMQQYMAALAEKKKARGEHYFELRLGINTGAIVAGVVGESKFAYDIWGDAVNLASRMESGGEPGRVNISENTHELIKDKFDCTYRGKISVKNKGEVDMYFVNHKKWW